MGVGGDETGGEGGVVFPGLRQEHGAARLGHYSHGVAMTDLGFGNTAEGREEPQKLDMGLEQIAESSAG